MDLPDLPVVECLPELGRVLAAGENALLVAPPGAGKTTLVPLVLLEAGWRGEGTLLVAEPRRLAARAAATRMAGLRGEAVGGVVGYRTRLDQAVSAQTRIAVVTTGLLLRRLIADPALPGIAAVLLDEVHERSLDADLALSLLVQSQALLRPDLRLLAMSATPETEKLQPLLRARLIASTGRAFPVTIRHAARDIRDRRDLPDAMARAARAAMGESDGDILCFLPGMAEIRRTEAELAGCAAAVLALHGDLPPAEQLRALTPGPTRRIVLASAIAETSLTVPGVRVVIDGGWRRAPVLDAATGLTRLTTMRVSKASATQRSGRAGREAPGLAIRLWTEASGRALPASDPPEILAAELSGLVLDCLGFGVEPEAMAWPDAPPAGALAAARALLLGLGALADGKLTALGRRMADFGTEPRLAAMILGATNLPDRALAADLAAILEERDFVRRPDRLTYPIADLGTRVVALAEGEPAGGVALDRGQLARVRAVARQYRQRLAVAAGVVADPDRAGHVLAMGFPDRVAAARGDGSFRLAGGGGAALGRTDKLARAKFLVAAALDLGRSARIALAAPFDPTDLPPGLAATVTEKVETMLDPVSGAVLARRRVRLGALVLHDRTEPADAGLRARLLCARAAEAVGDLPWTEAARQLRARIGWMHGLAPADWPDFSDPGLAAEMETLLAPALTSARSLAEIDLAVCLRAYLGKARLHRLDLALPERLALPHGDAAVDYTLPVPQASARAQAFYGLRATPTLADGRVGLRLALLSPAGRPIAITADIGRFWETGWADARRDMRGRYPKHDWPDRP